MNVVRRIGWGWVVALLGMLQLPEIAMAGPDVTVYTVYKRQVFTQTNSEAPSPRCCSWIFDAVVEHASSNSASAMLGVGGKPAIHLETGYAVEFLPMRWISLAYSTYPDQKALDERWPNGEYTFSIFGGNDGAKTSVLKLSGDAYPNAPHIQNYAEAQAVDSGKDFSVRWDSFEEGTTNDSIFVLVTRARDQQPISNTSFVGEANALDGTANSVVISGGTLAANEEYDVYVRFDKIVATDGSSYLGAFGQASYAAGTHFMLKTR